MSVLSVSSIANSGFTLLQTALVESVKEVSKKVVMVALAALSSFVLLYLACACCEPDLVYSAPFYSPPAKHPFATPLSGFQDAMQKVQPQPIEDDDETNSIAKASLDEEKKLVQTIKGRWLDDPQKELNRILDAKIFPDSVQKAMPYLRSAQTSQIFSVAGRVLELKQLYRPSHYVFTHGQAPDMSIVNLVMRECIRTFTPALHQPLKMPFRLPLSVSYAENADHFIKKHNHNVYDNSISSEVISVDAQMWSGQVAESALSFFSTATNINLALLGTIFKSTFMTYLPNSRVCDYLAGKAQKIAQQRRTETIVGVLYAICIPKDIVKDDKQNFAYPSHPGGRQCDCFPLSDRIKMLEKMQNDELTECRWGGLTQYRIVTARLTEEKRVRTFAVDPLPKDRKKFYRDQVKDIVKELHLYSHLYDLIEQLDTRPEVIDQINSLIEASPLLDPIQIQHLFDEQGSDKTESDPLQPGIDPAFKYRRRATVSSI